MLKPKITVGPLVAVPAPAQIKLTVLLEGGGGESLVIEEHGSLHQQLRTALAGGLAAGTLLDLPIRPQVTLTIPASRLIGILREPEHGPSIVQQAVSTPALAAPQPEAPVGVPAPGQPNGVRAVQLVQVPDVLSPEEHAQLLEHVRRRESEFVGTTTSTQRGNYRESSVLYHFAPFDELMRNKIRQLMPAVCEALKIPPCHGAIEAQLTAHNDNNFYKVHNDNGSADTAHRVLTFVYYFHRQPKAFTGGELVIYDHKVQNGYHYAADTFHTVQPLDNSIVFFASEEMHEVKMVRCPSLAFMDSRFTINGWLAR
jgi:predicted 2-oxoglutarate/Fe(II)-dependent dioxygenase YbiX